MTRKSSSRRAASSSQSRSSRGAASTSGTSSVSRGSRQQTSQPSSQRVQRPPQLRAPHRESPRLPAAALRHLANQVRSEVEAFAPQTAALDLTSPVPPIPNNVDFLVSSFVYMSGGSVLPALSGPEASGVLDLSSGVTPQSIPSVPTTAPTTFENGDYVTLDETIAAAAVTEGISRPRPSDSEVEVLLLDDDVDVEFVPAATPLNSPVEELVQIDDNPEAARPSSPYVEDALLAEASLVANRVLPRVPLLLDQRDHREANDRLRKTREAIPPEYPSVYQGMRPPYPKRKRIPERKSPHSFR